MKLLLDTHAFLWLAGGDRRLSRTARRRIEDGRNDKFLSVASIWEMAIKVEIGKLRLSMPLPELVEVGATANGIAVLPIEKEHAMGVATLPRHHADPFDRLLIVQAAREAMVIVGSDRQFDAYNVRRFW